MILVRVINKNRYQFLISGQGCHVLLLEFASCNSITESNLLLTQCISKLCQINTGTGHYLSCVCCIVA